MSGRVRREYLLTSHFQLEEVSVKQGAEMTSSIQEVYSVEAHMLQGRSVEAHNAQAHNAQAHNAQAHNAQAHRLQGRMLQEHTYNYTSLQWPPCLQEQRGPQEQQVKVQLPSS